MPSSVLRATCDGMGRVAGRAAVFVFGQGTGEKIPVVERRGRRNRSVAFGFMRKNVTFVFGKGDRPVSHGEVLIGNPVRETLSIPELYPQL